MGNDFANRSNKKNKKNRKVHRNIHATYLERQEYVEMAKYIAENSFTDSKSFNLAYHKIVEIQEPIRQQYNQMKAWYNLSLKSAENNFKGNNLEDTL